MPRYVRPRPATRQSRLRRSRERPAPAGRAPRSRRSGSLVELNCHPFGVDNNLVGHPDSGSATALAMPDRTFVEELYQRELASRPRRSARRAPPSSAKAARPWPAAGARRCRSPSRGRGPDLRRPGACPFSRACTTSRAAVQRPGRTLESMSPTIRSTGSRMSSALAPAAVHADQDRSELCGCRPADIVDQPLPKIPIA